MKFRAVFLGALLGLLGIAAAHSFSGEQVRKIKLGHALKGIANSLSSRAIAKTTTSATLVDRLALVKALYMYVNGGADGTWPSGADSALSGYDAPSEDLKTGFLGIVNGVMGPEGAVSEYLVEEGYDSCAKLPTTDTEFEVEDELLGDLTVTVGKSTREIPDGLQNSGDFERRIELATADATVAVIHLHCSTKVMTMLMRLNIELDNAGQTEAIEAMMEGSEEGPDVHMQFITQNTADAAEDMAIEFKTTDGDTYSIYIAHTSGTVDANNNGPAHTLAAITGSISDGKVTLTAMGGNTDITANSSSSDMSGLVFDADATFEDMDDDNVFCLDTEEGAESQDCPDAEYPGSLAVSGLAAWTMEALYDLRQGETNVEDISEY